jgi:hypothetical protein
MAIVRPYLARMVSVANWLITCKRLNRMESNGLYHFFSDPDEEIREILQTSGLRDYLENSGLDETSADTKLNEAREAARKGLDEIGGMSINNPSGEPSVLAGKYHIKMHVVVWSVLELGVKLGLACLLAPAGGAGTAVLGKGFDAATSILRIAKAIRPLNGEELQVTKQC